MKGVAARLFCLVLLIRGIQSQRLPDPGPTPGPSSRSYFILAPDTIRPGLPLTLSVSILDAPSDVTVTATILNGKDTLATATDTFSSGATGILSVDVPADESGSGHMLQVEGSGGLTFSEAQALEFKANSFSILVQTDRAIYKPGQTVHFRAMAINPDLKPYIGPFDAKLKDPNDNVIQQWMGLENADYGVVSGKTVMSDAPVLGDWVISVTANNQQYDHVITIDEYVLPKFEVIINGPPYALFSDEAILVTVEAKYTYGQPVKGSATMSLSILGRNNAAYTVNLQVDGKATAKVLLSDLEYNLESFQYANSLDIRVTMTESLTGIQQNGTGQVQLAMFPVKVEEAPGNPSVFKPGMVYTCFVRVTKLDGSLLSPSERERKLRVSTDWRNTDSRYLVIPVDGLVKIETTFAQDAQSASLLVSYYDGDHGTLHLNPGVAKSQTNNFLQLVPQGTDYEAGSTANFQVKTTEAVAMLSYQVFSKGSVVLSDSVMSNAPLTVHSLSFDVTEVMAPKARLVVSYVRSAEVHELVMDSVDLAVNGVFQNEVTVGFSSGEVKPGDSVDLEVTAEANSYVGILAIDTSVRLLKTGNDITQGQVIEALGKYDSAESGDGPGICPDCRFFWWPFPTPGNTATEILDKAGILVFSDALVYDEPQMDYYFREDFFGVPEAALPAAAPDADDAGAQPNDADNGGSPPATPTRVRSNFPETWLWTDDVAGADGRVTVRSAVPDTITSWVASAFSMSREKGIGVADTTAKVTVFKPFFVSLTLPYALIRGEAFVLSATIFNYVSADILATVTLAESEDYQILTNDVNNDVENVAGSQTKRRAVKAQSGQTILFVIQPHKLGMIDISVSAYSNISASDAVVRQLLVKPEGIPTSYSKPVFVDLEPPQSSLTQTFTFGYPEDEVVPGSVRAELSFTGDIMGPTIAGLDQLLQMPSGCGEQTMLSFAPDVFIHSYLTSTGQNNAVILQKAVDYMVQGYQRELTYKHSVGSFSAFGESDPSGSTWLTAFVVKSFAQASDAIFIDNAMLKMALGWILEQQASNGVFNEPGRVIHTDMQGGVSSDATMTAYVLITLGEVRSFRNQLQWDQAFWDRVDTSASLATAYLERDFDSISQNVYALALVTYALTLTGSSEADRFLTVLERMATVEDVEMYWSKSDEPMVLEDCWNCAYYGKPSSNIEMTGYALLTYVANDNIAVGAKIARWLTNQRNEYGGYSSTQDTVIGLQALSTYATTVGTTPRNINVAVSASADPDYSQTLTVDDDNSIVLQKLQLPVSTGVVTAVVSGSGTCLMQFSAFYNLMSVPADDVFEVTVTPKSVNKNTVVIKVCGRYVGPMETTGMAMMEVNLPTGFYADEDLLKYEVKDNENLAKYELAQGAVNLYLHTTEKDVVFCYDILAKREEIVINTKPSNVKMYDYYKPANRAVISYSVQSLEESKLCDTCPECCGLESGGPHITAHILLVALAAILGALIY